MADSIAYERMAADKVRLVSTTTSDIDRTELESRLAFFRDEATRIEEDYANRKAANDKAIAEIMAALKSLGAEAVKR